MASTRAKFGFIKGSSIIDVAELPSPLPKGTAINPLGTYDKFYFNTSLSVEEVESICSKLTYGNLGGVSVYNVIWDINQSAGITIINIDGHIIIGEGISNVEGDLIAFTSHNPGNENFVAGWKEFENPYPMSLTGDEEMGNYLGFSSGQQNELLSYLISSTPFESAKGINAKALYRLPDGTLWYYYNGQWNAVGSGSSNGIIEVETLPTENINTKAIYKIPEKFVDLYVVSEAGRFYLNEVGFVVSNIEEVETKPTSNIVESTTTSFYLYYVTSENEVYAYINIGYGVMWVSVSQLLASNDLTGLTFKGKIDSPEKALENGYYIAVENEKYYKFKNDDFVELADNNTTITNLFNGTHITKLKIIWGHQFMYNEFMHSNIDYLQIIFTETADYGVGFGGQAFLGNNVKTLYVNNVNRQQPIYLHDNTFVGNTSITKLIIDVDVFKPIQNDEAHSPFRNSLIANGEGYIYVPDNKVNEVKALSGWSNYASQIKPLSEYKEV
jgi:hypothetical protein